MCLLPISKYDASPYFAPFYRPLLKEPLYYLQSEMQISVHFQHQDSLEQPGNDSSDSLKHRTTTNQQTPVLSNLLASWFVLWTIDTNLDNPTSPPSVPNGLPKTPLKFGLLLLSES